MRLHETRTINRPRDEVFEYTADFSNIEEWDPGVASSAKVGDEPVGVGTKFEVVAQFGSQQIPLVYETTVYEPDERVVLIGRGETMEAVDEIRFVAQGDSTLVDYTADLTFHNWLRFLGPLLNPLMQPVGKRALDGLVKALQP